MPGPAAFGIVFATIIANMERGVYANAHDNTQVLQGTTFVNRLEIGSGGNLLAPEGKLLGMTVNGVRVDPLPGSYEGDIVLAVTDLFPAP